jgi:23S rRNA pseudouridine2605 synthase
VGLGIRLDRAISKLGYASRSQAGALIRSGRVRVDGRLVTDVTRRLDPRRARIQIDNVEPTRHQWTLVALNKPRGVLTTRHDPKRRPTVYDLIADLPTRVVPVGRLDFASTGLLLLTNDTRFANWLTDPATGVVRRYIVTVRGALSDETMVRLLDGIRDRDELLAASKIDMLKRSGRETHLSVELTEGRNREIRRMMASAGHEVTRLKRVAFGGLQLGDLDPGQWRVVPIAAARRAFPNAPLPNPIPYSGI